MEVYGRNSNPQHAWTDTGVKVGIGTEESMWMRPGVSDCVHYLRTGICGFGARCRFNHPPATMALRPVGRDYPKRPGELVCQHYSKTGNCKFGVMCKFDHPLNSGGLSSNLLLNYHGYPLRPGEKLCFYYSRMGQCKFGISCRYHHPEPPGVHPKPGGILIPTAAPSLYSTLHPPPLATMPEPFGAASTGFRMPIPPTIPGSYVPGAYGPMLLHPGVVPHPGWTSFSAPMSPAFSPGVHPSVGDGSLYGVTNLPSVLTAPGPYTPMPAPAGQSSVERTLPVRPGQPECQFYLRTGDCNYGSFCKFHHPPERSACITAVSLNSLGLPLRPDANPCSFYVRNGFCRFGTTCKFNHPVNRFSLMKHTDPAGSSLPTLPTSLSPDFSPQAARMSSFEATSSALVALTLSEASPV